jgi:hypothetical protein
MAFTIDFGGDDSEESEKKKLSLRDGHHANVTTVTTTSQAVRMASNTNDYVDRKQLTTPEMIKATTLSATRVVVDRENNIQSDDVARDAREKRDAPTARVGDAASEAGTYTIDQVNF